MEEITLEFCEKENLEDDQIPEDDDQDSTSTDYSEDEKPNSNYEDGGVTYAYKVKAVSFWKDLPVKKRKGRKTRRSFTCVQAMFKKLKSLNQLYRYLHVFFRFICNGTDSRLLFCCCCFLTRYVSTFIVYTLSGGRRA